MKTIIRIFLLGILFTYGCDPIEDMALREQFENAGAPISQAELDAALSVTQPIPNTDDKVEGDQYVVLKTVAPMLAVYGTWDGVPVKKNCSIR